VISGIGEERVVVIEMARQQTIPRAFEEQELVQGRRRGTSLINWAVIFEYKLWLILVGSLDRQDSSLAWV
jgi:hypothetical protein